MPVSIICPQDKSLLYVKEPNLYQCPACFRDYPVEDGVLRLIDKNDKFYEGAYENQVKFLPKSERIWDIWPLWLINSGYPWTVRRFVPRGATVVELGCAGGVKYFGRRYHMVGCDLSLSSLKLLDMYEQKVQSDAAACIPLPDNSADAVVSSYFWEHIPPHVKPDMLSECQRILKPGGKIIFLYDVETENPLIKYYKDRNKTLYEKLFIEGDGHFGYQHPTENIAMFEASGFQVLEHKGLEKTCIQSPSAYNKLAKVDGPVRNLFQLARYLGKRPWFYPYTALIRIVDTILCPFLPEKWARIDLVVCEKESR